ncbi:MAG: hypothetical protein ISR96_00070 [Nitrospira sp.]|nr:hypothetical protein [bacterium]MBL7047910.1 hypothetical protein [Nitrospira sp.]
MKNILTAALWSVLFVFGTTTSAEAVKAEAHVGYGNLNYQEHITIPGLAINSNADLETAILGVSLEFAPLPERNKFFFGALVDWVFALDDVESWTTNGVLAQQNDIDVFGQFYGLKAGYQDNLDRLSYRLYGIGGWDGLQFNRNNTVQNGILVSVRGVVEDFSLWKVGAGGGAEYSFGRWSLQGNAELNHYFKAEVENTIAPDVTLKTEGGRIDASLGVSVAVTDNINIYAGGSFMLIVLDSDMQFSPLLGGTVIFPESETEIIAGIVRLTGSF